MLLIEPYNLVEVDTGYGLAFSGSNHGSKTLCQRADLMVHMDLLLETFL